MPLPKSLTQNFRKNNLTVASGWRAFFAPYNVNLGSASADLTQGPTIFDLMAQGPLIDTALPDPWRDLGWIKDVAPTPGTRIGQVRSGFHGAIKAQYKGEIGETVEFKMREITRMAMKIATGSDVFNLLHNSSPSSTGPLSSGGTPAVPMISYDANALAGPTVTVGSGSGNLFTAGDYIVVDGDYTSEDGLIGHNATPVFAGLVTDVDYIRKTSDFVARVIEVDGDDLILSQPFAGGGSGDPTGFTEPQAGAKVQRIRGFASREGGTFIEEWSGIFLLDTLDGAQFLFYYPHLSTMQFRGFPTWAIENIGTADTAGYELDCVMNALAFDDPIDGHTVVGYRAFYPRGRRQDLAI